MFEILNFSFIMKIFTYIIIILSGIITTSCHKDNPTVLSGKSTIISISADSVSVGDTVSIFGEFLGLPSNNKQLVFDSLVVMNSTEVLLWHSFEIKTIIPKDSRSGYVHIVEKGVKLDSIYVFISKVPKFGVVEIPAGKFTRGSETSSANEQPAREITITRAFYISENEVSQRLYKAVMGDNPSRVESIELPVENVTWGKAVEFCNKLSQLHGFDNVYIITGADVTMNPNKNGWRLPTEAEWEYACRAGTTSDYAGNNVINDMGWYGDNSGLRMHPPQLKLANDFGVYDMHGNVWEWCWDFYGEDYFRSSPATDPNGPNSGDRRVQRGGSWNDGYNFARSANRSLPLNAIGNVGIRLVRNKE
jgi:formylglycine-generating enzyme required for sulfatase activity